MALQIGPTEILLTWTPSTTAAIGYKIYLESTGGYTETKEASGGSTNTLTLSNLQNGDFYTIILWAISQHLPSENTTTTDIGLGKI